MKCITKSRINSPVNAQYFIETATALLFLLFENQKQTVQIFDKQRMMTIGRKSSLTIFQIPWGGSLDYILQA